MPMMEQSCTTSAVGTSCLNQPFEYICSDTSKQPSLLGEEDASAERSPPPRIVQL